MKSKSVNDKFNKDSEQGNFLTSDFLQWRVDFPQSV